MSLAENNLMKMTSSLEKEFSLPERIKDLKTEDSMKNDITMVWQNHNRVADIIIIPDDPKNGEEMNLEIRRNKIMSDTENLLKDLGLCFLRKPNDFAERYGIEEFIIAKNKADIELFVQNKKVIYDDSIYDTSKEQMIVRELLGKNFDKNQQMRKAA